VGLGAGIAHPPEDLDDLRAFAPESRVHGLDHRDERGAPGRDPHDLGRPQRGFEIERGGRTEIADDLFFILDGVYNDGFPQTVGRLQRLLEIRVRAQRHAQRDADDALFLRAFEQPGHRGLVDVESLGDLGRVGGRCDSTGARPWPAA